MICPNFETSINRIKKQQQITTTSFRKFFVEVPCNSTQCYSSSSLRVIFKTTSENMITPDVCQQVLDKQVVQKSQYDQHLQVRIIDMLVILLW